jgi:tetratricopeptide (TPR) repeat protein
VKVMQRRATIAVALSLGLSAETIAQTRPGMGPGPDTPRLLVAVFSSPDRLAGVQVADALRSRVTSAVNIRTLYVVPKENIVQFLESSGYRADSSLGMADLKELGKQLRADEIVMGSVVREGTGFKVEPRLLYAGDPRYAQPLPAVSGAANDIARQTERSLQDARKQIPDFKACQNHLRSSAHAQAIAAANAGIAKYPNAVMARLCLANAFVAMKLPDSTLRVVNEVLRLDPLSLMGHTFAYDAYSTKGEGENAVRSLMAMQKLDPGNQTLITNIITELGRMGAAERALPIVDTLLLQNPGDPQLLRNRWTLTTAAASAATDTVVRRRLFGEAITAGENMVRGDTTLTDSTYFARQIGSATGAGNAAKALEYASRATQKLPRNVGFWVIRADLERRAGQLDQALLSMRQAMSIDPRTPNANVFIATIYIDQRRPDSAVAIARRAIAAGEDSRTWGTFLLAPTNAAVSEAQRKENADSVQYWERALALAQEAHRLAPQPTSFFLVGVSAFQIGVHALQQLSEASKAKRPDHARLCTLGKRIQDMWLITQTHMPQGGAIDRNTAGQVLGAVNQYSGNVDQVISTSCNRRSGTGRTGR